MLEIFTSGVWKYVAVLGLILALGVGIFEEGSHRGYAKGYSEATDKAQVTINELQATITKARNDQAAKAAAIVAESNTEVINISNNKVSNTSKVQAIAKKYTTQAQTHSQPISGECSTTVPVQDLSWLISGVNEQIDATFGD